MFLKSSKKKQVSFDVNSLFEGHHKVTYRGIKTIKCPFDYVMYQMIIWESKPDLIIEVGTNRGGSALYFADMFDIMGKGEIHTIDIVKDYADPLLKDNPRIKQFTDGYQGYDIANAKGFENILVIEDGSHHADDSYAAIKKLAPLVKPGGYLIVEDGIVNELGIGHKYGGGPMKAIEKFLGETDDFIIDTKWCNMFGTNATFNVNGYLKRVK